MIRDMNVALHSLHELLVAARNVALENPTSPACLDIVDSIEAVPLWMLEDGQDRTDDFTQLVRNLAAEYPECRMAASTIERIR